MLDGVGHIPMFEAPGRVTEVISELRRPVQPDRLARRQQPNGGLA